MCWAYSAPPGLNRVNWSAQICEGTALLITLVFMVWNGLVPTNIFWHSGGPEHIQHYLDDFTDLFASYPAAKLKVEQLNLVTQEFFKPFKLLTTCFGNPMFSRKNEFRKFSELFLPIGLFERKNNKILY